MNKISAERISQVINEEPLILEVDVKKRTWLQKLLKLKRSVRVFTVYPPTLGVMIKVSAEIEKIQGSEEMLKYKDFASILRYLAVNGEAIINILSLYLGGGLGLKAFLKNNITSTESAALLARLVEFSKLEDFLASIILTKGMSLTNTEGIIASVPSDNQKTSQE